MVTSEARAVPGLPGQFRQPPKLLYGQFDELKQRWGWGGYCTQDTACCRFAAMTAAPDDKGWSPTVRLSKPAVPMETLTSRPFIVPGVARRNQHGGHEPLRKTSLHAEGNQAQDALSAVNRLLQGWKRAAEPLTS